MADLENDLYKDIINLYKQSETQISFKLVKYLQMLNSGAKPSEVVKRLIFREGGSFDFDVLRKNNRLDLSVESIVIDDRYAELFSHEDIEWCRFKLQKCGYDYEGNN